MNVDIVDTLTNTSILTFRYNNLPGNGGKRTKRKSLMGITLPSTMGLRINSVSSPGTGLTSVPIDLTDALTFTIFGSSMTASKCNSTYSNHKRIKLGYIQRW